MARILFFLMFLTVVFIQGECTKCYMCNPSESEDCMSIRGRYPQECTDQITKGLLSFSSNFLQKFGLESITEISCLKITFTDGIETAAMRACVPKVADVCQSAESALKDRSDTVRINFCGICDSDGCNGGNGLGMIPILSLLLPCVVALIALKQ